MNLDRLIDTHLAGWRWSSRLLCGLLMLCLVGNAHKSQSQGIEKKDSRPNIIFIFADDWGYGDLGCYGATEVATPHLDKFASEGTRYTRFHVTSGVCSPSRSSVITGHFPSRHRVHGHFAGNAPNAKRGMPNWLDENLPVYMPRLMQDAGYTTAHFGKWHLGGGGLPHGDLSAPEPKVYGYDETRVWNGNGPTWKGDQLWPTTRYMDDDTTWVQSSSRIVVDITIDFLKRNKDQGAPMFINLWLKDPHTPLWPSDEQKAPYKGLAPDKETYFSVLTDADKHVGRLMQALQEMGLEENTLVIFSSDNGPAHVPPALTAGSTGGLKGRKVDLFEGGVNVPFIVKWKGKVDAGRVDSTSVLSAVDLLPTFAALAENKLPADYRPDGENISSIFSNQPFHRTKPLFWEWRFSTQNRPLGWVSSAILDGEWKLLADEQRKHLELYHIATDQLESQDLSKKHPQKVEELLAMWDRWKLELPD
ncbi:sulfatase family protein [Dyadobacter tibetensis]|uniref:sulfatase family protein n=1 Tax=Dyadobacter tibetensis TaxID=1211851 RepID=UPI0004B6BC66|nr:sulfatase-like hydrolase/transferase [Dyadobacter tibetensis]